MSSRLRVASILLPPALALVAATAPAEDRSIDGSGNHPAGLGAAGGNFQRLAGFHYSDGMSAPGGESRPNPRDISNALMIQSGPMPNSRGLSDFLWQWGQFIDHDMTLVPANRDEPLLISVRSPDDPLFPGPIPTFRSLSDSTTGGSPLAPREQINRITSFLDASMIYGSDPARAVALRSLTGGRLLTSPGPERLLPHNTALLPVDNPGPIADEDLFLAGDVRANEQVGLTALHTIWVREHNHWADTIAAAHPDWNDEQIYQKARRLVGAEVQAITYREWLPALLGDNATSWESAGYDSGLDPSIANEFATGLYRIGHTLVSGEILRIEPDGSPAPGGPHNLEETFFDPSVVDSSHEIDLTVMGLATGMAQEVDIHVSEGLRSALFGAPGAGGLDLASLNIQRGRDHGIAGYNDMRAALALGRVNEFGEITSDLSIATTLESLYGSVDDIDLWVGALAEDHLPGSSAGELLTAGINLQFELLRDGDRFYFLNDPDLSDLEKELVLNTPFSEILLRNTGLVSLQSNVFFAVPEPSAIAWVGLLWPATRRHRPSGGSRIPRNRSRT